MRKLPAAPWSAVHVEALAQASYQRYAATRDEQTAPWEDLSEAEREPNLHSAAFAPVILAGLGLAVGDPDDPTRRSALTPEEVEAGGRLEHLRWCRFTRAAGRAPHANLVAWADLDEPTRELDLMRVRDLPALLDRLGFAVVAGPA